MNIRDIITLVESESIITRAELLARYPGIEGDLIDVDDWMGRAALRYRFVNEPTSKFASEAESMLGTYDEFPKDRARTKKIMRLLKSGAEQRPIFCDADGFIMEGRHRFVAFYLLQLPLTPVVYVTNVL